MRYPPINTMQNFHNPLTPQDLVLSVDTSTPVQSVAIVRGEEILCDFSVKPPHKEGPSLLSLIDYALKHLSLNIRDMQRFVVCRGPGAFTSLRVSMALLKSFALSTGRPLYAASSLDALAARLPHSKHCVCACIDARRGEVYAAFYKNTGAKCEKLSQDLLLAPSALCEMIHTNFGQERVLMLGSGAIAHYQLMAEALGQGALWEQANMVPSAVAMAQSVLHDYPHEPPAVALEALEPKYIRVESFAMPKPLFERSDEKQVH